MLSLVCEGVDHFNVPTRKEVAVVLFFTPWNTLEIWDKYDYDELPRRWDQPDKGVPEPQRVYIDKSTLPVSTALPIDDISTEYDYDMQFVESFEHLPYGILMRAPHPDSVIAWHIRDSLYYINNMPNLRAAWKSHFQGTVNGKIVFDKLDDHGNSVTCNLSGVRVNLVYVGFGGKKIAGTTITDDEGNYNIPFDFNSYFHAVAGKVDFNIELVSFNADFDIAVKRRKLNRNKRYYLNEQVGIFDNANNGSVITHDFTILEPDAAPFQALHYAANGYKFMKTKNNIANMHNGLDIFIYGKDKDGNDNGSSHYFSFGKTIYLEAGDTKRESVVYHEFGHHVMNVLQGSYAVTGAVLKHPWPDNLPVRQAWCEGWGYGFAQMVDLAFRDEDGESDWILSIPPGLKVAAKNASGESRNHLVFKNGSVGFMGEYFIACALFDLFDGADKFSTGGSTDPKLYNDHFSLSNGYKQDDDDVSLSLNQITDFFKAVSNNELGALEPMNIQTFYGWLCKNLGEQKKFCDIPKIKKIFRENRICSEIVDNAYFDKVMSSDNIVSTTINMGDDDIGVDRNELLSNETFSLNPFTSNNEIQQITDNLKIYGTLNINRSYNSNPVVLTTPIYSCVFTIETGGLLSIGDQAGFNGIGVCKIYNNSIIKNGGTLHISNNSSLIIKPGGTLTIEQGAIIELEGNALIAVEDGGVVHIGDNATLSFTGTGRIKFIDFYPYYNNVTCGSNSKINLIGSTAVSPQENHVVLEVEGNESLCLPDNLAEFKVTNATIHLGDNCRINAACPIYLDFVRVTATNPAQMHRGLHTFGQGNIFINQCTFKHGLWGIHADNKYYYNSLKVYQTAFKNCSTAIWVADRGIEAEGLQFENCLYGVDARQMSVGSMLTNCTNTSAPHYQYHSVLFRGLTGGGLKAVANNFSNNSLTALWYKGPSLTLRCNVINNNSYGVYASPISLNMSETFSKDAGRNKIQDNYFQNIYLKRCSNIFLKNGYNNLSSTNAPSNFKSIEGRSANYHWGLVDTNGNWVQLYNIPIEAENNYWDDDATYNNPTARTLITNPDPSITSVVTMQGSSLSSGNVQTLAACEPRVLFDNPSIAIRPGDNGVVIWGDVFSNVNIEDAVSAALTKQYSDGDLITAISMYHDIITHVNYRYSTLGVREMLDICYGKIQEAISDAAADSAVLPIRRNGYLHTAFTKLIEVNNHFLADTITSQNGSGFGEPTPTVYGSNGDIDLDPDLIEQTPSIPTYTPPTDYGRKLELSYNTAFAYRMAQHHQTCLNHLNAMQTWVSSEDLPLLNYYQCVLLREINIINDSINKFELDSMATCPYPEFWAAEENLSPIIPGNTSNNTIESEHIWLLPNPTQGLTNIEIYLLKENQVSLTLYDVTGKKIKQLLNSTNLFDGLNKISIDLSAYSTGIYIIETQIGNTSKKIKIIKE